MSAQAPARAAVAAGDDLDLPLVSPARVSTSGSAAEVANDAIAQIAASIPPPPSPRSCSVLKVRGEVLSTTRADLVVVPGAVQMLVTGWAAIALLGPDHRFVTTVGSEAPPTNDGVLAGSLYLVGGGDPVLMTPAWATDNLPGHAVITDPSQLADAVVAAGVSQVLGAVIGVESRYDQVRYLPGLSTETEVANAAGPLGALRIDGGTLTEDNETTVDRSNPAATSAARFDDLLEARGVMIAGLSRAAPVDDEVPDLVDIASVRSPPLAQIVNQMLAENDVGTAEILLKEIGFVLGGDGSTLAGARLSFDAVRDSLGVNLGAPPLSGSGWDSIGTATCASIAEVVQAISLDGPLAPAVASYHAAALGEPLPNALVVRGELGDVVSVAARAPLAVGIDGEPGEVIIVSIANIDDGPTESDRQYVRDLVAAIGTLQEASGPAAD